MEVKDVTIASTYTGNKREENYHRMAEVAGFGCNVHQHLSANTADGTTAHESTREITTVLGKP